jgi:hypothetical protein
MKSINEIKKAAHSIINLSKTNGEVDKAKLSYLISLIQKGSLESIGIRIGKQQTIILLKQLLHLYTIASAEKQIRITTAYDLTDAEKQQLQHALANQFHHNSLTFVTDTKVLGGVKIQNGWDIIDNSLQAHLQLLHT